MTERRGRQICDYHFSRHKDKTDNFNLYDAFGFKKPLTKTEPVKLKRYCVCGEELQPRHRLCENCAAERERQRKREYYHRSKEKEQPQIIKLICKEIDCENEREPGHRYCRKCAEWRSRKSHRKRQQRYWRKQHIQAG